MKKTDYEARKTVELTFSAGAVSNTVRMEFADFKRRTVDGVTGVSRSADAHAGDDWIVAAHPDESALAEYRFNPADGKTLHRPAGDSFANLGPGLQTQKLTVWRTLNVECDAMAYYDHENTDGHTTEPATPTPTTPPNPVDFLGMTSSQLARACVEIKNYSPNNHQPIAGHTPMSDEEFYSTQRARIKPGSRLSPEFNWQEN